MRNFTELSDLLRARVECIWIHTEEEADAEYEIIKAVRAIPGMSHYPIGVWSPSAGLVYKRTPGIFSEDEDVPNTADFQNMFRIGIQYKIEQNLSTVWVLKDLPIAFTNPKVARTIRDIKEVAFMDPERDEKAYNPIIVISQTETIPEEIQRLFRVVKFGLPEKEEIETVLKTHDPSCTDNSVVDACLGLTAYEINMIAAESIVHYDKLMPDFFLNKKIQLVQKTGVLNYKIPEMELNDIGGNENIKNWLQDQVLAFSPEAKEYGIETPKGFMAVGIPGCGKTAIAEAFAKTLQVPLLELFMSKIMDKLVGQTEQKIARALDVARKCAPCVLLLDEVEKMLGGATVSSNRTDGGVTNRVLQELLKFMNETDNGVYVIMTSNDVSQLPPEFTRAGRLDTQWYFGLPNAEERKSIVNIYLKKKSIALSMPTYELLIARTEHFTGAEIKQTVKNILLASFVRKMKGGENGVIEEDIIKATSEVTPIYESSKEKLAALQLYCKGRAKNASSTVKTEKAATAQAKIIRL